MIVPFATEEEREREAERVAAHLRGGGLIAYPTETVYGFGCAIVPGALERLAALKGRAEAKPFLLLIREESDAPGLLWTDDARRLARAFWPGPLTLVVPVEPGRYPPRVSGVESAVAVRHSPHAAVGAVLEALGGPITSTSVNLPGQPPATTAEQAGEVVAALGAADDLWLLDGGTLPPSSASTIVSCTGARPRVLRRGAIPTDRLRTVVDEIDD